MATGFSWNTWFGGREPQSMAFLSAPESEKLYSGLANRSPSAAATSPRKRFADSGSPASKTSWLKSGMSSMRANVIVIPAGMSSAQSRNAAVLKDPLRRLPLTPRIFRSATRFSLDSKSGECTAPSGGGVWWGGGLGGVVWAAPRALVAGLGG